MRDQLTKGRAAKGNLENMVAKLRIEKEQKLQGGASAQELLNAQYPTPAKGNNNISKGNSHGPIKNDDGKIIGYKVKAGQGPSQIAADLNSTNQYSNLSFIDIVNLNTSKFQNVDDKSDINNSEYRILNMNEGDILNVPLISSVELEEPEAAGLNSIDPPSKGPKTESDQVLVDKLDDQSFFRANPMIVDDNSFSGFVIEGKKEIGPLTIEGEIQAFQAHKDGDIVFNDNGIPIYISGELEAIGLEGEASITSGEGDIIGTTKVQGAIFKGVLKGNAGFKEGDKKFQYDVGLGFNAGLIAAEGSITNTLTILGFTFKRKVAKTIGSAHIGMGVNLKTRPDIEPGKPKFFIFKIHADGGVLLPGSKQSFEIYK